MGVAEVTDDLTAFIFVDHQVEIFVIDGGQGTKHAFTTAGTFELQGLRSHELNIIKEGHRNLIGPHAIVDHFRNGT
jgi:hypothetical protein